MIRRFCSSVSEAEASTSKEASIREAVTFACWPPGPDERDARIVTSLSGIAAWRPSCIGSSIGHKDDLFSSGE